MEQRESGDALAEMEQNTFHLSLKMKILQLIQIVPSNQECLSWQHPSGESWKTQDQPVPWGEHRFP